MRRMSTFLSFLYRHPTDITTKQPSNCKVITVVLTLQYTNQFEIKYRSHLYTHLNRFIVERTLVTRWLLVLDLIMKDNGGNRLVETHRGKLTNNPTSVTNHNEADVQAAMRVTIEGENNGDDADDNDENC